MQKLTAINCTQKLLWRLARRRDGIYHYTLGQRRPTGLGEASPTSALLLLCDVALACTAIGMYFLGSSCRLASRKDRNERITPRECRL